MPFRHDVTSFREILLLWSNSFGSFFTCCVSSFFVTLKLAPIPSNKGSSHVMVTSQIALCNSTVATSSWNWYDTYNHEFVRKVLCFFLKFSTSDHSQSIFPENLAFFWSNFKEYCIPSYNQSSTKYILFHGTKEVADCFLYWIFCWNFFVH